MRCSGRSRMHEPSVSQSRPRLGCLCGTFSPSRRQIRSTRLSFTSQPACAQQRRDLAVAVAAVLPGQLDDVGGQPLLVVAALRHLALRRAMLPERRTGATLGDTQLVLEHARCRRGDARGLEVSPGGLLQDQLVQRQIRHRPAQPGVLRLQLLQPLHLVATSARHTPGASGSTSPRVTPIARIASATGLALRRQNINLPQLRDDLFRLVSLPRHCGPP